MHLFTKTNQLSENILFLLTFGQDFHQKPEITKKFDNLLNIALEHFFTWSLFVILGQAYLKGNKENVDNYPKTLASSANVF